MIKIIQIDLMILLTTVDPPFPTKKSDQSKSQQILQN